MKIFFKFIFDRIRNFFVNPFWMSLASLLIVFLTLLLNGLVWYLYIKQYRNIIGYEPISFSSAVFLLNLFLAAIVYKRETLASYILLSTGLTVQIIFIVFLRFLAMSQAF